MQVQILPPIPLIEGRPHTYRMILQDSSANPVDFTEVIEGNGWTGRFTIATDLDATPVKDVAPTLTADGEIIVEISPADFASFTPPANMLTRVVAMFQIELFGPIEGTDHIFQGPVTLTGII